MQNQRTLKLKALGKHSRGFVVTIALFLTFISSPSLHAQQQDTQQNKPNLRAEARALKKVIAQLTNEAELARENRTFEFAEPSIKARWAERAIADERLMAQFSDETILTALIESHSRDSFVDAYIRWQLTSYEPKWSPLEDAAFFEFMQHAPGMVENPKSNPNTLRKLEYAENLGPMSPQRLEQFKAFLKELDEQETLAIEMNRPAREYREWVLEQLGETGAHPTFWKAENISALIHQGWQVSTEKGNFTRDLTDAAKDESFTNAQRRLILNYLLFLSNGPERSWLKEVTWLADGSVEVSLYRSYISKSNVEKWAERLLGEKVEID